MVICDKHLIEKTLSANNQYVCKSCKNEVAKQWYEKNKEKVKLRGIEYRKTNKEKIRAGDKKYREENTEAIAERRLDYMENKGGGERQILRAILRRCENPNDKSYNKYGEKGIAVSSTFKGKDGFDNFIKEVGPRPSGKTDSGISSYTIERIDTKGNYEPGNVRWDTHKEQNNNRSCNLGLFSYNGNNYTLQELCELTGKTYNKLYHRIVRLQWDLIKAIEIP